MINFTSSSFFPSFFFSSLQQEKIYLCIHITSCYPLSKVLSPVPGKVWYVKRELLNKNHRVWWKERKCEMLMSEVSVGGSSDHHHNNFLLRSPPSIISNNRRWAILSPFFAYCILLFVDFSRFSLVDLWWWYETDHHVYHDDRDAGWGVVTDERRKGRRAPRGKETRVVQHHDSTKSVNILIISRGKPNIILFQ